MIKGAFFASFGYFLWGILPIYWKNLDLVPASEIMLHRIFWTFLVMVLINLIKRNIPSLLKKLRKPKNRKYAFLASVLLATNWFLFVWAVSSNHILEASLGYFINPLLSVLIGVVLLKERLRKGQIIAIFIALAGVIYMTLRLGKPPWVSLALALTFGFYGFCKKRTELNSIEGLAAETLILFIPVTCVLIYLEINNSSSWGNCDWKTNIFLTGAGLVTAAPLIFFAAGARRITLSLLGMLQYIAPILQFAVGVFVYNEIFALDKAVGFGFIWIALIIYTVESYRYHKKMKKLYERS